MPVITISSSFGSGGSVIASRVGQRLGWPVHNRAIPVEVASRLAVPLEIAEARDEASESGIARLLARFSVQIATDAAGQLPPEVFLADDAFRGHTDAVLQRLARSPCVIVGRAGAIVLRDAPDALHVRCDGDAVRRTAQGAAALGIRVEEANLRRVQTDRARATYWRVFYGRDWHDPSLYHIWLDTTALSLDAATEIVLRAAADRLGAREA